MQWPRAYSLVVMLSGLALVVVAASLWYSNRLVGRLAAKEERLVEFWAEVAEHIYNNGAGAAFLVDKILLQNPERAPVVSVPAILVDANGTPIMNNYKFGGRYSPQDSLARIEAELADMRANPNFQPIRIELPDGSVQRVFYRETDELIQLRYFPYITFGVLGFFVVVMILNVVVVQRSRLNKVWVGLAKETAHQLGTPISGLMAWSALLREQAADPATEETVEALERDIGKLERVADRFSKIGSPPQLVPVDLEALVERVHAYYRRRSAHSVAFETVNNLPPGFRVPVSVQLFEWVLENLFKNALDANAHRIAVYLFQRGKWVYLDVEDDGQGMTRAVAKRIFRPGYSTKKRGWGLGLSLAQRIVRVYHKGRISVKHTEPGKGTAFRIQLPIR